MIISENYYFLIKYNYSFLSLKIKHIRITVPDIF